MKILLLNQPVYNRGDEAAHRSLIRTINNSIPNALITIVLENIKEGTIEQIRVDNPNNTYININTDIGYRKSRIFSICSNLMIVSFLIRSNRVLANYIKESDIVICAPGGICLGGFYNWSHLYIMKLCNYLAKPIIYYSRSIGPFNPQNILQKFFCSKAQTVLKNVDFLSLRDAKSMDLADTLSISYIKAIDSAFLDVPNVKAPDSVKSKVSSKPYVVFVPNQLTWHPTFCNMTQESIDKSYLKMIEIIACKTDYNIVMLPQLYLSNKSDYEYFKRLQQIDIKKPLKVHIKIDSGLCRLGLNDKMQVKEVVQELRKKPNVEVEGIFTHFATDGVYDISWDNQYAKFQELTSEIDLMQIPIVHLGRSQTLLNHNKIPFANGIRLGIIIYGYNTTPKPLPDGFINELKRIKREWYKKRHHISKTITDTEINLKTAFSLYSEVVQVKQIEKGSFVGYGRIYEAPEDMYVAVIPIGYADGFSTKNKLL